MAYKWSICPNVVHPTSTKVVVLSFVAYGSAMQLYRWSALNDLACVTRRVSANSSEPPVGWHTRGYDNHAGIVSQHASALTANHHIQPMIVFPLVPLRASGFLAPSVCANEDDEQTNNARNPVCVPNRTATKFDHGRAPV